MNEHPSKELIALVWMAAQYLEQPDGSLDHQCMVAGERALRVLFEYRLVDATDRGARWTEAGRQFLNRN